MERIENIKMLDVWHGRTGQADRHHRRQSVQSSVYPGVCGLRPAAFHPPLAWYPTDYF